MKKMISRLLLLSSSTSSSMMIVRPAVAWLAGQPHALRVVPHRSQDSRFYTTTTALRYQSSSSNGGSGSNSDDSAMSRSRAPFRMPRHSPDDSMPESHKNNKSNKDGDNIVSSWNALGLWTELVESLTNDLQLEAPTPVQNLVIPALLREPVQDTAFLAATGSGKTLAYCLPLMQQLKNTEVFGNEDQAFEARKPKRPRFLIIAPTRELVMQIKDVVKQLGHSIKLSSRALIGGQDYGKQRKALNQPVDVIVSTPGRLLQHWKEGHVFFGDVEFIVLDEMDTLLEQGFQKELQQLLYPLLWQKPLDEAKPIPKDDAPKIILTSATMTKAVEKIVSISSSSSNNNNKDDNTVTAKRHYTKPGTEKANVLLPPVEIIKAPGLHKAVPRLEQVFVDVGNIDKISLLVDIVSGDSNSNTQRRGSTAATTSSEDQHLTIVFCNTAASCRAAQFALAEARIDSLSYHGELNSIVRTENLKRFRQAGKDPTCDEPRVLVCTDLAARGLDIPQVDHIVMFDFPLNALDYLHRSGRTARGVADATTAGKGKVTALVAKRDKVLATAIEHAVVRGEPLDGLSARKSDYLPGGRLNRRGGSSNSNPSSSRRGGPQRQQKRSVSSNKAGDGGGRGRRSSSPSRGKR